MHQYIYQRFLEEFYPTLQQCPSRNRDQLFFAFGMRFPQRIPKYQDLLDSNLNYLVASGEAPVIRDSYFLSFNIQG